VLVARGQADDEAHALYARRRPSAPTRVAAPLDDRRWAVLRHPEDDPDIGALFALLEPMAAAISPLDLASLGAMERDRVAPTDLRAPFAQIADYVADRLEVSVPAVYRHPALAGEVHVGAAEEPALLVGPDALASEDRVELAFRLGRSMTYLRPGRAVGGSRPA